ncbi:MAG: hypothetical protein K2X66_14115, partial [Cyanobacteria bacterium]|nr:hypothetical protein [Cyanobacteriota bacterium]
HLVFEKNDLPALRLASGSDNLKLQSLYNESLPSEVRLSLEKIPADFGKSWGQFLGEKFQGVFSKRWILEDTARDMIFASLDLVTHNYVDFQLTILVSGGYQTYFEPMVLFGIQQALKNTANAKVYLHVYDFQKMQHASLEGLGFKCLSEVSILVKDYWIPLEDRKAQSTSPILIFPGKTSPA